MVVDGRCRELVSRGRLAIAPFRSCSQPGRREPVGEVVSAVASRSFGGGDVVAVEPIVVDVTEAVLDEPVVEQPVADEVLAGTVVAEIVDEAATEPVVEVAGVESLFMLAVEEPRARRGRRFGRIRAPEPEPVIAAAVDEVVESWVVEEPAVDDLVVDVVVEDAVVDEIVGAESVIDPAAEEVAEAVAVDEPVVDDVAPVVEEPRAPRGRRFGRRRAPEPEVIAAAVDEVVESSVTEEPAVEELVVDVVVENSVVDEIVVAEPKVDDVTEEVFDEPVVDEPVVDELVADSIVEEIVGEAAAGPVVEVAVVELLLTPVVEEPRARRGRRFGRRRAPEPEAEIAAVVEVVDSLGHRRAGG
jgi:hypothetical protein